MELPKKLKFGGKLTINEEKRELERYIRAPGEPLGEYAQQLKITIDVMFPESELAAR